MFYKPKGSEILSKGEGAFLLELGRVVVPQSARLSGPEKADFLRLVDETLAGQPWLLRLQARAFLAFLRLWPLLACGGPFATLGPERRAELLRGLEDSRWTLWRKGFWGVKTLIFMGYYGRPAAWSSVGYRPSWEGNERLKRGG